MERTEPKTLEDLGYGPHFESGRIRLGLEAFPAARVTSEYKGAYDVRTADGEYVAKITGRHMFEATTREDYPAVGDWVAIEIADGEHAVVRGILPRKTIIKRRSGDRNRSGEKDGTQVIAANIDVAFVVESIDRDYSLNRFERYLAIVEGGGAKPAIVLNKVDLISEGELDAKLAELARRFPGIDAMPASAIGARGLDMLRSCIEKGLTYCFLGSSGVGKSSFVNRLLGADAVRTGDISSHSGRGKHTTTRRQMYFLEGGGIVIDNPGIREVGIADADASIGGTFDDVARMAEGCKYADCTHVHEPGCRVREAVNAGMLDEEKYSNYLGLRKEAEYQDKSDFERRDDDRRFGKMMKTYKKESKRFKH